MATPSTVDIFLAALNQQPADHAGPIGRISALKNGIATHYLGGTLTANGPTQARLKLDTRRGFLSLSSVLRESVSGNIVAGSWANPEALASIDDQLVSICNSVPAAFNGTDWTQYGRNRVWTNRLDQDVFHTTDKVLQVPDSAVLNGVKASVWTETVYDDSGATLCTTFIGFKRGNAWVRPPSVLYGPGAANKPVLAKIVADTYFYVFVNIDLSSNLTVYAYNEHGVQLATNAITKNSPKSPGDWDVSVLGTGAVSYTINPIDATVDGSGNWVFPEGAFLASCVGSTFTVSGDSAGGINGTYTIDAFTDATHIHATPTPTVTLDYSMPPASADYFGGGVWNFPDSVLDIPVGSTVTITNSDNPPLDGVYTVLIWNNGAKIATMDPAPTGAASVGGGATIIVTYPADLPYQLQGSDVVTTSYTALQRVVLIQPTATDGVSDEGVDFSTVVYNGSGIVETRVTDTSTDCIGPISFVTNDLGDALGYFATLAPGEEPSVKGWQTTGNGQIHEYDYGIGINHPDFLDSFVGFASEGVDPHEPTLTLGVGFLPDGLTPSAGPKYDPDFRNVYVIACDFHNATTVIRENNSTIPVSRAFKHNDEYAYISYMQSGSGNVATVAPIAVSHASGDFMTGPTEQTLTVRANDATEGSPILSTGFTILGPSVTVSNSHLTPVSLGSPDNVTTVAVSGMGGIGIPDGTHMLRWEFAGLSGAIGFTGSRLVVSGSNIASANATWDIVAIDSSNFFITPLTDITGSAGAPSGVFSTGTFTVTSLTSYIVQNLASVITQDLIPLMYALPSVGSLTVTSSAHGNNITNAPIRRITNSVGGGPNFYGFSGAPWTAIWVDSTTQSTHIDTFNASISPANPYHWYFNAQIFDDSYIDTYLTLTDPTNASGTPVPDLLSFKVTGSSAPNSLTTDGPDSQGIIPFLWKVPPFPLVTINQDITQAYRFRLGDITFDYNSLGGLITVQGDTNFLVNNGVYKILQLDYTDPDSHTVFVQPVAGSTQRNQLFDGTETITIFPPTNTAPELQPLWFITPMTGTQPQVGCFERGLADADWRQEGQLDADSNPWPNLYPRALTSVNVDDDGIDFILPYRAKSFQSGQLLVSPTGQVVNAAATSLQSTIGLKTFTLSSEVGQPLVAFGELMLPGPLAGSFNTSGFHEQGLLVNPEAPFQVSQETDTDASVVGLVPKQKYTYQIQFTAQQEDGEFVISGPSPILEVTLTGDHNTVTIGGRLPVPINSDGTPIDGTYGLSNRANVTISIYRSAVVNGVPVTNLYQITNPLNSNGPLYSGSGPGSGFTFISDGGFSWTYRDQAADSVIVDANVISTGQGFLPTYPAPPFSSGVVWQNRAFLCGYDGALWMSNEKQEGSSLSFFPGFRYVFPSEVVACAALDSYLYVFCEDKTIWTIPAATYPDATGNPNSGSLPTPRKLPFRNSCTGFATTIREGVVYSSTAGNGTQLWLINRSQQNVWLSQPIQDSLIDPIIDLAVDGKQRLYVSTGGNSLWCYDGIPDLWSEFVLPSATSLLTTFGGAVAYQDSSFINVQQPEFSSDIVGGTTTPIPLDITFAGLSFAHTRDYTRLWALQLIGQWKGDHNINATITYPDDMPGFETTIGPVHPDLSKPYLLEINPINELCSQFGLRVWSSFEGIESIGESFSLELISAKVGLRQGQRDVPAGQRLPNR